MKTNYDCVIIGAGPAGLAAAIKLWELGIKDILLVERNSALGGILNQCIHTGFGISYFKKNLTGPEYAFRLGQKLNELGIPYLLGAMVLEVKNDRTIRLSSKEEGYCEITARSIITATGCRERTRENIEIAGSRPAGVFTAGQAQNLINMKSYKIGRRVIVQGSGDIGLIMARRLMIEGYEVLHVFERLPYLSGLIRNKVQCLDDFGIPITFGASICGIEGHNRVEGVFVENVNDRQETIPGTKRFYECDTVLFSVGLIPEVDILKNAGISFTQTREPKVNSHFESNIDGVFICGNSLHIHDLADNASNEGELVAGAVANYLKDRPSFDNSKTEEKPYRQHETNAEYNTRYFEQIEQQGLKVCIICPKGCLVSETQFACPRGKKFFLDEKTAKLRQLTTSVRVGRVGCFSRISVKSVQPIDIKDIPAIKKELKTIREINGAEFTISVNGAPVRFLLKDSI